jgi:ABC-2 type transport system ATP-binding protein
MEILTETEAKLDAVEALLHDVSPRVVPEPAIEVRNVSRHFGKKIALQDVSLSVERGEIHALLGPNGAGKTTLVRLVTGLQSPTSGTVRVLGHDASKSPRTLRQSVGCVPSGDRSFYQRISGFENLLFFARLYGYSRTKSASRAWALLDQVGLTEAAKVRMGLYSHGMQKRLSIARALLIDPAVLIVDEPTHDLDPEGAQSVRRLVTDIARRGAAVIWTTQRIEEIRGFCDRVTLLNHGRIRFAGSVAQLMAHASPRHFMLRVRNGHMRGIALDEAVKAALAGMGSVETSEGEEHYLLSLDSGVVLGDALAALTAARIDVLTCGEARSEIEEAFLSLTAETMD